MRVGPIQNVSREHDEWVLSILAQLAGGAQQKDVAARMGTSRPHVAAIKQRVMADDVKHSGEDPETVKGAY